MFVGLENRQLKFKKESEKKMKKGTKIAALFGLSFALMGQSAPAQTSNSASPIDVMYNQIFTTPCLRRFASLYQQHERDMQAQVCIDRPEFNSWRRDCANETVELVRRWNTYCDPHVSSYAAILALPVTRQASHTPTPPPQIVCEERFRAHHRNPQDTTSPCVCPEPTDILVHVAGYRHRYGCALSQATSMAIINVLTLEEKNDIVDSINAICRPIDCRTADDANPSHAHMPACPTQQLHAADCREWRQDLDHRLRSLDDLAQIRQQLDELRQYGPALALLLTPPGCETGTTSERAACGMRFIIDRAMRPMPVIPPAVAAASVRRPVEGVVVGVDIPWQTGQSQMVGAFGTAGWYHRRDSRSGTGASYWNVVAGAGNYGDGVTWMIRAGAGWAYNVSDSFALSIGGTGHVVYDTEPRLAADNAIVNHLAWGVGAEVGLDWQMFRHLVLRLSCAVEYGRTIRIYPSPTQTSPNRHMADYQTGMQITPRLALVIDL